MNKNTVSYGIGLTGNLTVLFGVLKLIGVIDWSWWWVFSPILIDFAVTGALIGFILLALGVYHLFKK